MDHLRAGVGLLPVVGQRDRVELADELSPMRMQLGYFQVMAEPVSTCVQVIFELLPQALAALGHEVVDAALAFLVAGVPVLHGRVLDRRVVQRDQLDHRRVQLVLVAHRRGAALEVADGCAFVGDDQRALELARARRR